MEEDRLTTSFPPLVSPGAKILILGSFPGEESLRKQEYYGHPRNVFWFIIRKLFQLDDALSYPERVKALTSHGIAVWDVLLSCRREGSLDSSIDDTTIQVNDFQSFFCRHEGIKRIFFNGTKAETEFRRRVLNSVKLLCNDIHYYRLPSTSPAMAMLTRDEKLAQWAKIMETLV
jgi:double-stranded uracil-DNA glycosylase